MISIVNSKIEKIAIDVLTAGEIAVKRNTVYLPPYRRLTREEKKAAVYLAYEVGYDVCRNTCLRCGEARGEYERLCHVCFDSVKKC